MSRAEGSLSGAESAERGRNLLAARTREASEHVLRVPDLLVELESNPPDLPRVLVTTGIGTSEGHARHLAEAASRWLGQPARFATTGSLARHVPPASESDWLVVFSQGLSANARHALRHVEEWGGVLLVTGFRPEQAGDAADPTDRRAWLEDLESRGVIRVDMGCGVEEGSLLRVIGARVGYCVAWSLLRTLAARRLEKVEMLEFDRVELQTAQTDAALEVARVFPDDQPIAPFFSAERTLILVAEGGALDLAEQLSLKLAEGMLRPQPRCVDVLQFAHGPLQSLATRPSSILYLSQRDPDAEATEWLDRLTATLDPTIHDLRVLRAQMPLPFAVIEYEAMLDECVLRTIEATGANLVDWPGAAREGALYEAGPLLERGSHSDREISPAMTRPFEDLAWPEVEVWIEDGRRTALIALGSIEQHGRHLPLGTDRFIADALARGLAERLPDAIALPALAIGCAREHLDFPGTLHIEPATLEAVLRDLVDSLERHAFERAFVFSAHGGNIDALKEMSPRLCTHARAGGLELGIETDLPIGAMQSRAVAKQALAAAAAGPHAGEFETSLIAMLRPGTVRRGELRPGRIVEEGDGQELFYPSLRPNSESGVLGDPSEASADRGAAYLNAWIDLLETAYLSAFSSRTEKKRQ